MEKYLVQEIRVSRRSSVPSWDLGECEITEYREWFDYGEAGTIQEARENVLKEFSKEWQIDQYGHIWEIAKITKRDEDGNPAEYEAVETRDLWAERVTKNANENHAKVN